MSGVVHAGHGRIVDVDDPDRAWAERVHAGSRPKVVVVPDDPLRIADLPAAPAPGAPHDPSDPRPTDEESP